ncbi:TBC1 domain family member 2B-like [Acanthaster planci]|uniref:TBC1 domain family member 2B-like n=1 Tax=Acanthaster planci TaxID=133434 RepID=A0A8B7YS48_ACAPL|nr:TBC1 domain family member 2B-like [Acanthaster planci]
MAVPYSLGNVMDGRLERRKLHDDTAPTSEVPTAVLISFDDEPSLEGTTGNVADQTASAMQEYDSDRATESMQLDTAVDGPSSRALAGPGPGGGGQVVNGADGDKVTLEASKIDSQKRGTMEEVKLCGYLNKMGEKGLIKTFKTRWFVFDNQRCRLYYYRTPQDLLPLGSIDIANASFNFEASDSTGTGHFHISTGGRVYQLQAKDRHTMMFWLQELQERRRAYSHQRTSLQRDKSLGHVSPTSLQPKTGLVSTQKIKDRSGDPFRGLPPILGPVELPTHSVGESTAHTMQQTGMFNLSLTNLKTEIRNQMSSLGLRRNASDEAPLVNLASETSQTDPPKAVKRPSSLNTAPSSGNQEPGQSESLPPADQGTRKAYESFKAGFIKKFGRTSSADIPSPTAVWFENESVQDYECAQCRKFHSQLNAVQEELELVENEVKASQEVITMLHKQLTATQMEHSTNDIFLQSKTDKEKLLILNRKDKQLIQLEQLLQEMREDRDRVVEQLRSKEREVDHLNEQISMFMELITAKDQVVMSLTSRVHELEQNEPIRLTTKPQGTLQHRPLSGPQGRGSGSFTERTTDIPFIDQAAFDKLKDACQAFETQNKFLNTEILELNKIREDDLLRERMMFEKHSELEAEFYRTQSKYLLLLDQLKTPKRGSDLVNETDDELISRLIEEAIESDTNDQTQPSTQAVVNERYDRYGFIQEMEENGEEASKLASKAAVAQRRSEEIESQRSDRGISLSIKWENYLVQHGDGELTKTLELKFLVRQGIPHEYRHRVWKAMVEWHVKKDKELTGPGYYDKLIKSEKFKMNPATKQIELDLLRTLPTNKNFDNIDSKGIPSLRRVLKAYSVHNPTIGYCQGLNRVAAISLLFLDEEDAFWCLVAIVECIMPADYYSKTLIGSQTDQRVFKDLLTEKLPRLSTHLDNFGIDLSLISFNWFITVFCDNVPPETMLRIWGTLLYEGNKVLFRFALAFFKMSEAQLLVLHDYIHIFNYLRKMTSKMTDISRLTQIAFDELSHFPRRHINNRRAVHRAQIKQQLEELDKMRDEYVPQHRPSTEGVISDDDEDYDTVEALGGNSKS